MIKWHNPFRRRLKRDEVVQSLMDSDIVHIGPKNINVETATLQERIAAYIAIIQTRPTRETCYCEWTTHPADVDLPRHEQRAILKEHHDWCPVHEKQGFLLGFFVFLTDGKVVSGREQQ